MSRSTQFVRPDMVEGCDRLFPSKNRVTGRDLRSGEGKQNDSAQPGPVKGLCRPNVFGVDSEKRRRDAGTARLIVLANTWCEKAGQRETC